MNGESHVLPDDDREMAFALVDRALTAMGGLETPDPIHALDMVLAMYRRALAKLRED